MRVSINAAKAMLIAGLFVFLTAGTATVYAQNEGHGEKGMDEKAMKGKEAAEVTLVGEVLDMYCYMKHPMNATGADHMKCAQSCIRKGLPIGFLSDGVVYLIIGKDHESAKDLVVDFAGTQASLTGKLVEHDGVKAIELDKIEKADMKSKG